MEAVANRLAVVCCCGGRLPTETLAGTLATVCCSGGSMGDEAVPDALATVCCWGSRLATETVAGTLAMMCCWSGRAVTEALATTLAVACGWDGKVGIERGAEKAWATAGAAVGKMARRLGGCCPKTVLPISTAGELTATRSWDGRAGAEAFAAALALTCGWDGKVGIEREAEVGKMAGRLGGCCSKMVLPISAAGMLTIPVRLGKSACAA
jgi:hypothetical protein